MRSGTSCSAPQQCSLVVMWTVCAWSDSKHTWCGGGGGEPLGARAAPRRAQSPSAGCPHSSPSSADLPALLMMPRLQASSSLRRCCLGCIVHHCCAATCSLESAMVPKFRQWITTGAAHNSAITGFHNRAFACLRNCDGHMCPQVGLLHKLLCMTWLGGLRRLRRLHRDGHMMVYPSREGGLNGVAPGGIHP